MFCSMEDGLIMNPFNFWIFIISLFFVAISGLRCPIYWQQNGDSCYRFRFTNLKNWTDAEAWCLAQNSDLVKIETVNERNWLVNVSKSINGSTGDFWTGLRKHGATSTSGAFVWPDRSAVDSSILQGQAIYPSNFNADCVKFSKNNGNRLNNAICGSSIGYICERHIGIPLTCNADERWQSYSGYCYKVFYDSHSLGTWDEAQQKCNAEGGNLFTVESDVEEGIIHDYSKNLKKNYWIGVRSYQQNSSYTWLVVPNNATLSPRLTYWNTPPSVQSANFNNTCVYVSYATDDSQIAWTTDLCNVKKNFVCKRPEGTCQPGWLAHQDRCYQLNSQYLMSWQQATQYCRAQGGDLLANFDKTGTDFLTSFLINLQEARISSIWIGVTDNNTANYTWPYSQPLYYQNWYQNPPPNTPKRQDCVYISTDDAKGQWRTTPNCGTQKASICTIGFDVQVNTVPTPQPTLQCDDHWTLNSGLCFQFNDTRRDYLSALQSCQGQGGSLATVNTNDMHSFVINRIQNDEYWIGLNDQSQNGKYIWTTNNAQSKFFKWCPNEPNDYGGDENCVEYSHKCFNDQRCSAALKYICSKPPKNIPLGPPVTTVQPPISENCGIGWEDRPQSQNCYSYHDDQLSWNDARQVCQNMGGDLASIHTPDEQVYIQGRISTMASFWLWLGGTDRTREGGWSWSDGTPFEFLNWASGEPNGQNVENCIQIYSNLRNQQWNDGKCNSRSGFICKKMYGHTTSITPRPTPQVPAGMFLGCPAFWRRHGNSCWHFVSKMITETAAKLECQKSGGYLATINNPDEQNFMFSNLPKPLRTKPGIFNGGAVWIGLSDSVVENYFQWDDRTPVQYTNWASGEPNNFLNKNEDCTAVWLMDGGWFDESCNTPLPGYVCKKGLSVVQTTGDNPLIKGCTHPYRGYGYGASCYALQDTQPVSWQDAQNACQTKFNGNLATVNDRYVHSFIASYIDTRSDYFWIGLSDQKSPGTYSWINGQADTFTFWHNTHTGNERGTCVAMRTTHPIGLWENKNCTETHNYICESPRTGFTKAPVTQPSVLPCPTGWTGFSNFCYKVYAVSMTWTQASDFCQSSGGDLLSVHSQQETDFLVNTLGIHQTYWLGVYDWGTEGTWLWSDKTGLDYTNWNPTEPNNWMNNEDCAFIIYNGKWIDANCFNKAKPICKRPKGLPLIATTLPPIGITSIVCGAESLWLFYNGACYMISPPTGSSRELSWYDARTYCNQYGSDLASVHTTSENNFLYTQAKTLSKAQYWIGLNELGTPGTFQWIDNTNVDFVNWDNNEPNDDYGQEKCTALLTVSGKWNDDNCGLKSAFFCKKRVGQSGPVTQPTTVMTQGGCQNSNFLPSPFSNKCFYAANSTLMTWNQSAVYCQNSFGSGYDLASINSEMEQAFLTSLVQGITNNVWIGLQDFKLQRQFGWTDNSPFTYQNWNSGEPNGRTAIIKGQYIAYEQCVDMLTQPLTAGNWRDQRCDELRFAICQGPKVQGIQTPSPVGQCSRQGYVVRGSSCYKFVTSSLQTWQVAENICQGDGGVLASINDKFENAFIESQIGPNVSYWIGLKYEMTSSNFGWQKNWPVRFTSWASGEPSDSRSDICVKSMNGKWDASPCTQNLGYVCEINTAPVPSVTPAPLGHCLNSDDAVYGDFCYHFDPFANVNWPSAQYACRKRKMNLVSIANDDENNFVFSVMLNARDSRGRQISQNIWLGLNKGFSSGFQWTDNSPFSYNHWNTGEPSDPINSTKEECVEMYRDSSRWNDVDCNQRRAFICKARTLKGLGPTPTYPTFGPPKSATPPGSVTSVTSSGTIPGQVVPHNTPSLQTAVTFRQPTGYINGPKNNVQTRVLKNKTSGLTGGSLAAVIIVIVLVLGVSVLIGLLWWKKRNPSNRSGGSTGFDNAMYDKTNDKVDIDSSA